MTRNRTITALVAVPLLIAAGLAVALVNQAGAVPAQTPTAAGPALAARPAAGTPRLATAGTRIKIGTFTATRAKGAGTGGGLGAAATAADGAAPSCTVWAYVPDMRNLHRHGKGEATCTQQAVFMDLTVNVLIHNFDEDDPSDAADRQIYDNTATAPTVDALSKYPCKGASTTEGWDPDALFRTESYLQVYFGPEWNLLTTVAQTDYTKLACS
jgi:hypothetical protein